MNEPINFIDDGLVPAEKPDYHDFPEDYTYGAQAPAYRDPMDEIDNLIAAENPDILYKLPIEARVMESHRLSGKSLSVCAHMYGMPMNERKWWTQPKDFNDEQAHVSIDLVKNYENPLIDISRAVAACVQFPLNTAFLHACGCFSAALIRKFDYSMFDSAKPIGLYTVAAQPPGAGKSPVNSYFTSIIRKVISEQNKKKEPERKIAQRVLGKTIALLEKCNNDNEMRELAQRVADAEEKAKTMHPYEFGFTDTTPEALEEIAAKQDGRYSIVSPEAEAVTVITGINYGNGNANLSVMLGGWDRDYQKTARIGRQGYSGLLTGAIAVMAQESTVTSILNTGRTEMGSRGVCERFWIMNEPNILHKKTNDYVPVPRSTMIAYESLVRAVIDQEIPVMLTFSEQSLAMISELKAGFLSKIVDGAQYSDDLMRGVISKAETQICKMAAVLHCAREWSPIGSRQTEIQQTEVAQAAHMYVNMIRCFVSTAEDQGVGGNKPELLTAEHMLVSVIKDPREPKTQLTFAQFCDKLKSRKMFRNRPKHRPKCKLLLASLQESNHVVYDEAHDMVYINPWLRNK